MHDEFGDFNDIGPHVHDATGNAIPIEGLETFTLRSVGIDIGSSTSHLVFSELRLRREGTQHSPRLKVAERNVLYRSPILLTPYSSETLIDTDRVIDFVHAAYESAGFSPEEIDTGAVVVTGEALAKENAEPILEFFARDTGKFICASAGPHHEALLAAYGSGAVEVSAEQHCTVLNVDMGGGTTKLSLCRDGVVEETAAVSVGARLLAVDAAGKAARVERPAHLYLPAAGHGDVRVGDPVTEDVLRDVAAKQVEALFELIEAKPLSALTQQLMVTEALSAYHGLDDIKYIVFSGGVAEFLYRRERGSFGDMGAYLADHVRDQLLATGAIGKIARPAEGIRATVIGAGEYTIQASGATGYLSSIEFLPAFGLKVVRLLPTDGEDIASAARRALAKFDLDGFGPGLILALSLEEQPSYQSLRRVAEGIAEVVDAGTDDQAPLILLVDTDVAKSLGGILKEELDVQRPVIVLDGIEVGELDYVDVGRPLGAYESVPVTVKSLMFPARREKTQAGVLPGLPHQHAHEHTHA